MKAEQALPWQEIIVPAATPDPWPGLLGGLAALLLLALVAGLLWRWWRRPRRLARRRLGQIRRQLQAGRLSPREALFASAGCLAGLPLEARDRYRLQQRFAPEPPSAAELEGWLQGVARGLERC